jgi:predicted PurR-regulated permease PerM
MTVGEQGRGSVRREIVFAFALLLALYVAWLVRAELLLLYVSALFAVVLTPVVEMVAAVPVGKWRPFRHVAVLVLPMCAVVLAAVFAVLALPPVVRDLTEFSHEVPGRLSSMVDKLHHLPFADLINTDDLIARAQDWASKAAEYVLFSVKNWAGALFSVLMGFALTLYFIVEGDTAYRWFLSFFPRANRERLDGTLRRAEVRMGRWLLGQGGLMLILGVASTIVYLALGVRYAYALGVLTGLLNIIPVLGAAVCIALALAVAAMDSWGRVAGVAVFYLVWLQLENSVLVPRIMKSSVGLPGIAILVALLLGSALGGVVGAMVAVPTAVLVAELVNEYLVNKDAGGQ